jgi:hypothetical protein
VEFVLGHLLAMRLTFHSGDSSGRATTHTRGRRDRRTSRSEGPERYYQLRSGKRGTIARSHDSPPSPAGEVGGGANDHSSSNAAVAPPIPSTSL